MLPTKDEVTLLIYGTANLESRILVAKSRTEIPPSPVPKEDIYFIGTLSEILQGRFTLTGSGEFHVSSENCALKVMLPREPFYVVRIRHDRDPNFEWVVAVEPESEKVILTCVDPIITEYSPKEVRVRLQPRLETVPSSPPDEDEVDVERFRRM